MMRLGAIVVAVCMVVIAASLGAVLYFSFGFDRLEAAVVVVAALTGLALFNNATTRARDRSDVGAQIADLSRGTADLARQVGEIGRKVLTLEAEVAAVAGRARAAIEPVSTEIVHLSNLLKEVADAVAVHEQALLELAEASAEPVGGPAAGPVAGVPAVRVGETPRTVELGEPENAPARAGSDRSTDIDRDKIVAVIRSAVAANRVDLFLQPIVTLPQRKVRYYEATTRLRTDDGDHLVLEDHVGLAESAGLMPTIDNLLLFRCVQVVRRLLTKNREIGLFCAISGDTLVDAEFFPQISDFMQANRALASSLVFELAQPVLRAMGPIEHESLAGLADLGFRFCLDGVVDLRIEPRELADRSFRFVKAPAGLLLNRAGPAAADIHPADFSDLLGRFGIDLIADRIDSEGTVVDLLDFDVRFGQGVLFSPPRPVKAEVLQGIADRPAVPAPPPPRPEPARPSAAPRTVGEAVLAAREADAATTRNPADRRGGALAQLARGAVRRA
jgi:cyclic-di-GMP phosphodiesterase TipF (flagellum assembly factor)